MTCDVWNFFFNMPWKKYCYGRKQFYFIDLGVVPACGFFLCSDMLIMDRKSDMTAQDILSDLSEVERDITLRRLLWQSQEDWTKLYDEWTTTRFESVNVEVLQKSVNKFIQTIYMLEKG